MSSSEDDGARIRERLAAVKAKRGYLLPHHGLMAVSSERLLNAYDQAYAALALEHKVLSVHDREVVWLAVLIATDEAIASHHIPKFMSDGGTMAEFEAIARLAAFAMGARGYVFLHEHWRAHLSGFDAAQAYRDGLLAAARPLSPRLTWLAVAPLHAARGDFTLVGHAITAAYAAGVPEAELAEALSIMMFPGSVPRFVEAAKVWLDLIRAGTVTPSAAFQAWADLDGQGGYDEASNKRSPR
ncbi:MAG: carboxymuconolactone decarboxylase family protein [Gammaproteobacteria bacterium]|nr:carboxymuconolactone decarboxylase family protein [Gammaproteobacteria bacterium]